MDAALCCIAADNDEYEYLAKSALADASTDEVKCRAVGSVIQYILGAKLRLVMRRPRAW